MVFDPSKYGAVKVQSATGTFDPSKYGAVAINKKENKKEEPKKEEKKESWLSKVANFVKPALTSMASTVARTTIPAVTLNNPVIQKVLPEKVGTPFGDIGLKYSSNLKTGTGQRLEDLGNAFGGGTAAKTANLTIKGLVKESIKTGIKELPAVGFSAGAGRGLQEDQSVGDALTSGVKGAALATAVGLPLSVAAPFIGGIIPTKANKVIKNQKAIQEAEKQIFDIENNYVKTRKNLLYSKDANSATRKRVVESGIFNDGAVNESGRLQTKQPGGAAEQYRKMTLDGTAQIGRKTLEKEGASIDPVLLSQKLKQNIEKNSLIKGQAKTKALADVDKEIAGYTKTADGQIPLTELHDAKIATTNVIKDFATPAEYKAYQKSLASGLKEVIEDTSKTNIKEINKELEKYLKDLDLIESLDGKLVKGGKLVKYFAQISGNIVGGAVGGAVGGFPGAALGTVIGGETAAKLKGSSFTRTFGKVKGVVPKSEILQKAIKKNKEPQLLLPAGKTDTPRSWVGSDKTINLPAKMERQPGATDLSAYSNNLGNRNINQSITKPTMKEDILDNVRIKNSFDLPNFAKNEFPDNEMENSYQAFLELLKDPKIRNPKVKEAVTNGDLESLRKELVTRGIMNSEMVDNVFYSQEMSSDELLNVFKDRLLKEDPGLLVGRTNASNLKIKSPEKLYGVMAGFEPEYDENGKMKGMKFDTEKAIIGLGITSGIGKVKLSKLSREDISIMNSIVKDRAAKTRLTEEAELEARRIIEGLGLNPNIPNKKVDEIFKSLLDKWSKLERKIK